MERRISTAGLFFFKEVLPFSIFVRSYSSLPTLQGRAAVREYRHDKNTAYSGSLDARSDKTNTPPINQAKECALALTIEREVEAIEHSRVI